MGKASLPSDVCCPQISITGTDLIFELSASIFIYGDILGQVRPAIAHVAVVEKKWI